MATFELRNVSKVYDGNITAVNNVNLFVESGELVVLVGPSGCGKTTILRMIAGLEKITQGELLIDGQLMNDVPPKDRDIAMVFQNYALYPHMTVYENMSFGLRLRKTDDRIINERVMNAAEILGLTELLERKPAALSGGQKQRVAVGRAIVRNPKIFLFDEPLSNLDAKLRTQMRAEIMKLHKKLNATMVYVTHDQIEAMTLGDKIVVLNKGEVQQVGQPLELYEKPVNMFVAGFIGSPAMNFINGVLNQEDNIVFNDEFNILKLNISKILQNKLKVFVGKKVVIGFRPETVSLSKDDSGMDVEIEFLETLGSESVIYFKVGEKTLTGKINSIANLTAGEHVKIKIDSDSLHFFDPVTTKRIN